MTKPPKFLGVTLTECPSLWPAYYSARIAGGLVWVRFNPHEKHWEAQWAMDNSWQAYPCDGESTAQRALNEVVRAAKKAHRALTKLLEPGKRKAKAKGGRK